MIYDTILFQAFYTFLKFKINLIFIIIKGSIIIANVRENNCHYFK